MARTCTDCGAPIGVKSKGRCRRCACMLMNTDPTIIARREKTNDRHRQDPAFRARHATACREAKLRQMQDPAFRERMVQLGHAHGRANFHHANTPDARARAHREIRRRLLAWCPEEFWDLNRTLKRAGYRLPDRQRMIRELIPGTAERSRLEIANFTFKQQLRVQREREQAY